MKPEIWKDIKGYEGVYQVSNLGRAGRQKTSCGYVWRYANECQ